MRCRYCGYAYNIERSFHPHYHNRCRLIGGDEVMDTDVEDFGKIHYLERCIPVLGDKSAVVMGTRKYILDGGAM
jgi:hypothetical protein